MNLTLPLTAAEEAKLLAKAQAEGMTPEQVVRQAIEPILASVPDEVPSGTKPKQSSRGLLSHLGHAPSAEDIAEVRTEMLASFPREDF